MYCATITVAWCLRARMRMNSRTTSMRISSMGTSKRTRIFPLKVSGHIDPGQGGGLSCLAMASQRAAPQAATPSPPPLPPPLCVCFSILLQFRRIPNSRKIQVYLMREQHISRNLPKVLSNFARFQHVVLVLIGFHWKLLAVGG